MSAVKNIGKPEQALIARAENYPFDLLDEPFALTAGQVDRVLQAIDGDRVAVMAIGSNASPSRLIEKFGSDDQPLFVVPARLRDRAVVFSAHLTGYASMPATLVERAGAQAAVAMTFLTPRQLERMHLSESLGHSYTFETIDPALVDLDVGVVPEKVYVYESVSGPLRIDGNCVRLAEVATLGSGLPALYQRTMLRLIQKHLEPELTYPAFLGRVVGSSEYRAAVRQRLAEGLQTAGAAMVPEDH
ncbi:MAG: hypothetical protein ACFB6S_15805 [Geminicoccaceae bacterium]